MRLDDLQDVISSAGSQGKAKRTCKNIKGKMAGFLVWATDNKYGHSLDCNKIKIPVNAKEAERTVIQPNQLKTLFSESTITRSMQTVQCHYIYAFRLIVCLGLRSGELCGLKVMDYDGTTLTINRSINRVRQITPGKTVNAHRTIVLMGVLAKGERCVSTTNRNFVGRMGDVESEVILSGVPVAASSAVLGRVGTPDEL